MRWPKLRRLLAFPVVLCALFAGGAVRRAQDTCGPFTDVSPMFCPYVLEAYYTGITAGTSPTTFSPDVPITRGQAAVFVTKGLNQALGRGSRRAALGQWWTTTPHYELGLGVTSVGALPLAVACDGQDVWTANSNDSSVSRVRASDGKLLETWTGADGAFGLLVAMGRVFVLGRPKDGVANLYALDPSQPAGAVEVVAPIGGGTWALAFDGTNIWSIFRGNPKAPGAGVAIVHPGPTYPWTSTIVKTNIIDPEAMAFDGQNIWIGDSGDVSLKKLDAAGAVIQTVPLAYGPVSMTFDGSNIWVTSEAPTITVVSAATGSVLATLTGNGLNTNAAIGFDGSRILVTNVGNNSVSLWRAADLAPLGSFVVSDTAFPFAVASDGVNFWLTLLNSNLLARF